MVCVPLVPMNSVWLRARRFRGGDIAASTRLFLDHNRLPKHGLEVLGQ